MYVATCAETAISEIRPHPGHFVSVGKFKCRESLRVLDFSKPTFLDFPLTDVGLRCFDLVMSIEKDLSMPITPERRPTYISAQFIAELIRQRGFDGVLDRSSVSKGKNLCTFFPRKMACVPNSATVFRTMAVFYDHEELPLPS
ncbi:MAG: RES family NAD+ phosphorylase [Boseongicola sp. SB0676_bin_33]|uniref:RES family NAD+ phosphorylase n=1 Tax=Boseongicola sp. SB0664_bin_43 TaxID=2604844 RepID=A0A6B0Y308_9RHOB|nr:RES family NAD+ phosphorylase [Boseongicola sp. SB0664_bin_43]MYF89405.1 RES family NAD+ phosphorylase [Boseongicola sp. SB0676_bin_33]MYK30198.1 RES family NAD+ phosphorylase [Boseongicola sp. SB0670_bin_30]